MFVATDTPSIARVRSESYEQYKLALAARKAGNYDDAREHAYLHVVLMEILATYDSVTREELLQHARSERLEGNAYAAEMLATIASQL